MDDNVYVKLEATINVELENLLKNENLKACLNFNINSFILKKINEDFPNFYHFTWLNSQHRFFMNQI
jgi:hypothetical protein